MSELHNPLFDEEREFLERKKLEYERALRGDVDHIKDQSVMVGKVALVSAGLAGGIWLITKAFTSKKRPRHPGRKTKAPDTDYETDHAAADHDDEFGATYFTAGNGKRYKSTGTYKSAADSASVFAEQHELSHEADDLGFGATAAPAPAPKPNPNAAPEASPREPLPFDTEDFEDDPFRDMPYDDSRRLSASHAFDDDNARVTSAAATRSRMLGSVLQAFLQSDTGKVLVAQVAAVALAMVTKKISEFFPAAKNSDLATSPGYAPAETGFSPVASSASPDFLDASTHPHSNAI
ncbi:hypothetical protein [Hymenobacter sp.]|uniref:hypothetical protein n=1 Tax=Hymenobacter sp. TaxID=1898978 RepID=UPI00286B112B|nr:hypothetical protein [Hymenobacter sp.]